MKKKIECHERNLSFIARIKISEKQTYSQILSVAELQSNKKY